MECIDQRAKELISELDDRLKAIDEVLAELKAKLK